MMYRYMIIADTDILTLLHIMDFCKTRNGGTFVRKYFNKNSRMRSVYNTIVREMAEANKNPGSAILGAEYRKYRRV